MLILHLQRIIFDMDALKNVKLNERIEFPEKLNMKAFMTKNVKSTEVKTEKKAAVINEEAKDDDDQIEELPSNEINTL